MTCLQSCTKEFGYLSDYGWKFTVNIVLINTYNTAYERVGLGCVVGLRPIVCLWDLGLQRECPPRGVFPRDPSPFLHEFRRKS